MQPRLKTSKKWTSFPKEYTEQIQAVFEENFEEHLDNEKITVEGRIYPGEVVLRVGLKIPGQLRQANFEASVEYSAKSKDALERIHNCVDAAASMMADYFENGEEADLPLSWQEYPFQGRKIFLQFSTENSDLEAQANALLGETAEDLVVDESEKDEDALSFAEADPALSKDLEDQDDEDFGDSSDSDIDDDEETNSPLTEEEKKSPRMFSGAKNKSTKKHH